MGRKIFVNLPVKDLNRSKQFFTALGFTFDPRFTDETAACMIIADDIHTMLITEEKFKTFTPKTICDATKSTEVLLCISCESREAVDEMISKAAASGGSLYTDAKDYGFMYYNGFQDPDGHIWEVMHLDTSSVSSKKFFHL